MPQLDYSSRDVVNALPPAVEGTRSVYDYEYEDYLVGPRGLLMGPVTTMKAGREHDDSSNLFEKFSVVPKTPTEGRKTPGLSTATTNPSSKKTPSESSNSSSSSKFTADGGRIKQKPRALNDKFPKKYLTSEPNNGKKERVFFKHRHSDEHHKRLAESDNCHTDINNESPFHQGHSDDSVATSVHNQLELSNHIVSHRANNKTTPDHRHTSVSPQTHQKFVSSSTVNSSNGSFARPNSDTGSEDCQIQHKHSDPRQSEKAPTRPNSNNSSLGVISGNYSLQSTITVHADTGSKSTQNSHANDVENTNLSITLPANNESCALSPPVFSPISDADSDEDKPFKKTMNSFVFNNGDNIVHTTNDSKYSEVENKDCNLGEERTNTSTFMPKIVDVVSLSMESSALASNTSISWPSHYNAQSKPAVVNSSALSAESRLEEDDREKESPTREKVVFKIKQLKAKVICNKNTTLDDSSRDSCANTNFCTSTTPETQNDLAKDSNNSPQNNLLQTYTISASNTASKSKLSKKRQADDTTERKLDLPAKSERKPVTSLKHPRAKRCSVRGTKRGLRKPATESQLASSNTVVTAGQPSIKKRREKKSKKAQNALSNNATRKNVSVSELNKTAAKTTRHKGVTMTTTAKQGMTTESLPANLAHGQKSGVESADVEMSMPAAAGQSASQDVTAPSSSSTGMIASVVSNESSKEQQDTQILISLIHSQLNEMTKLRQRILDSNEKQAQLFERLSSIEHMINARLKTTLSSSSTAVRSDLKQQIVTPQPTGVCDKSSVNSGGMSPTTKRPASPVETGNKTLQDSAPKTKKRKQSNKAKRNHTTVLISDKQTTNELVVHSTNLPIAAISVSVQNPQTSVNVSSAADSQASVIKATASHVTQHVASTNTGISTTIMPVANFQSEASRQEEISRAVMSITRSSLSTEDECVTNYCPIVTTVEDNPEQVEQLSNSAVVKLRKAERSKSMSPVPAIQPFKRRYLKRATTLPPQPPVIYYSKSSSPLGNSGENLTYTAQSASKVVGTSPVEAVVAKSIAFSPAATEKVAAAAAAAAEAIKPHAVVAIHPLLTPLVISENEELPQRNATVKSTSGSPHRLVIVTSPCAATAPSASFLSSGGQLDSHETDYSKQQQQQHSCDDNTERVVTATVRKPYSRSSSLVNDQVSAEAALNNSNPVNQLIPYSTSASHGHHRQSATETEYHLHQMQEHPDHHRQPVLHHQPPYSQVMSAVRMSEAVKSPFRAQFQPPMHYHQAQFSTDAMRAKAVMPAPLQTILREAENQLPTFLPVHQYVVDQAQNQPNYPHLHQHNHQPMPKTTGHVQAPLQQQRLQHHTDQQQPAQWHHQETAGIDDMSMSIERSVNGEVVVLGTQQMSPNVRYVMTGDNSNNRPPYTNSICPQPNCKKCEAQPPPPQPRYQYPVQAAAEDMGSATYGGTQASPTGHRSSRPPYGMFVRPQVRLVNQPPPHHQQSKQPHHRFVSPNIRQMYSGPMPPPYQAVQPYKHGGSSAGVPVAADVTGEDVIYVGTDSMVPNDANGRPGQDSVGYPAGHHRLTYPSQLQQPQTHRLSLPATCNHYLPHPSTAYKLTETASQPHSGSQGHARVVPSTQQPTTTSRGQTNVAPTSSANGGTSIKMCDQCKKPAHLLCSGCRQGHYCSSECQAASWLAGHNKVCRWTEQSSPTSQFD